MGTESRSCVEPDAPIPQVDELTLPNGLSVMLAPLPESPTASVWVWYRIGSRHEWPGVTGASHWVEHMMFNGSPRYPKGSMDRAIVETGGYLNAFTDVDFTAYLTTVPAERVDLPLDIESDRMTRASVLSEEVERERAIVLSERERNENWPEFRAEEELWALAFRRHPYRWDPLGFPEDIRNLGAPALGDYYRRFYGPHNATLVVAGRFDAPRLSARIQTLFSALPPTGETPPAIEAEPIQAGERRSELEGPGTTPFLLAGWRAPAVREESSANLLMLDVLLGGETRLFSTSEWGHRGDHPSSRLYRRFVEPGLAVRAESQYGPRHDPGLFTIHIQCAAGIGLDRVELELDREIERFTSGGPNARELSLAREKVRQAARLSYEGATRTAFRLGYFTSLGGRDLEPRLLQRLLAVSAADLRRTAQSLFRKESRSLVRYTPKGV